MKKLFFLTVISAVAMMLISSCNSAEGIMCETSLETYDIELAKLYDSIDSLQNEFISTESSRVDWDKWGRRGLNFVVDGFLGVMFAETGPLASVISVVGSGLYEDYLDYIVERSNAITPQGRCISRAESSKKAIVFSAGNSTFIDSIGYYHNLIIDELQSSGQAYTDENGTIDYVAYYNDAIEVAEKYGIKVDNKIETKMLFQYLESTIKPMAQLEVSEDIEINFDAINSIIFNSIYYRFNYDDVDTILLENICEKIIYNCSQPMDNQLVEYGNKVNELILNSNIDDKTKDKLRIANNISINSSLRNCGK